MTRRGPKSVWSARNVERIGRLEAAGRMAPAGRAAVDSAKADGRWEAAYSGAATAEVPGDLAAAIAAEPRAQAMFDVLTSVNRFALIYRTNARQAGRHPGEEDRGIRRDARPARNALPAEKRPPAP